MEILFLINEQYKFTVLIFSQHILHKMVSNLDYLSIDDRM